MDEEITDYLRNEWQRLRRGDIDWGYVARATGVGTLKAAIFALPLTLDNIGSTAALAMLREMFGAGPLDYVDLLKADLGAQLLIVGESGAACYVLADRIVKDLKEAGSVREYLRPVGESLNDYISQLRK